MSFMMQPGQNPNTSGYGQQFAQQQSVQQPMGNWQALYSMYNGVLSNMLMTNQLPQQYAGFVSQRLSADINSPQMQQQLMMTFGNRQASPQELQQYVINLIRNYADMARAQMGNQYNNGYNNGYGQMYQQPQQSNYYNQQYQPQQQMYGQQQPMYDSYGRPMYQSQQQSNYYTQQYQPNPYQGGGMRGCSGPASVYERAQQHTQQNQMAQYAAPDVNRPQTYSSQQNVATASQPTQPVAPRRQMYQESEPIIQEPRYYSDPEYDRFLNNSDAVKSGDVEVKRVQKIEVVEEPVNIEEEKKQHLVHLAYMFSKKAGTNVANALKMFDVKYVSENFIHICVTDELEVMDEPHEQMLMKFDNVEQEVEEIKPVTYKDKENNTEVTDFKPVVDGTIKVFKTIKAQGAAFSGAIERRVVKEFNDAMHILWTVQENDSIKCPADMKNFADIEDLITSINDPVMRSWSDEGQFMMAVQRCLNYSLFSIFGKGKRHYLDARNEDDLFEIIEAVPELRVDGKSVKSILASGNLTDEMKKKIIEAADDKFVFCVRRKYVTTNMDLEFDDELGGVTDFKKHTLKRSVWTKFFMELLFNCNSPVRMIRKDQPDDKKIPVLLDSTFNNTPMVQRIVP